MHLFRTIGQGETASLLTSVVVRIVSIIFIVISMLTVDKIGQKALFMIEGAQMFLSQISVGGIIAAKLGDHGSLTKGYALSVLIFICLYVAGFALSWSPLAWLVASEIYPLEIRSAWESITVAVELFLSFIIGLSIHALPFQVWDFLLLCWMVASGVFIVHFLLPERKNVPIEQMDKLWREHWFWKRFIGQVDEEGKLQES
ncbi:hypothetical protein SLA2020_143870 [Shorea laevis]